MRSPPDGLPDDLLVSALSGGWDLTVTSMSYLAVGWGSHHWAVTDAGGTRWFVTADELETKRHSLDESLTSAFGRLRASLAAAASLRACGLTFVVAPVPALDGEPLVRAGESFGVALYPFADGRSFPWGEFSSPEHRRGMLDMVIAVHAAPPAARRHAMLDDFSIPHRDELEAASRAGADVADCGPYARAAADLLASNAAPIRRLLARYDELAAQGRDRPGRAVLTHGEPHPGNSMRAQDGWLLIDWDTVLVAPPERDLWGLDPGDGSVLRAYAEATAVTPLPSMLELYRLRWDLADVAVDVSRFRRHHTGTVDDRQSWDLLHALVTRICA